MKNLFLRQALKVAVLIAASLTVATPGKALAYDTASTAAVNLDAKGIAVQGYDVVAYQTIGAATKGSAEFTAKHEGANYHFSSAANRDLFTANPAKFAPAFGGFCAMGVVLAKKLNVDPATWKVVDGKLHLNLNMDVQKKWSEDMSGHLKMAAANWPKIKAKAPKDL